MPDLLRRLALLALASLLVAFPLPAQVEFSGDARFRPRLDLDDRTGDPARLYETQSLYYMYRLRLNMTAPIGAGYYVRGRIAHNGIAYYEKGGKGRLPDVLGEDENFVSDENAQRPSLDLMYIYIGRQTERFGFDLGLVPVPGFSNPLWDLHYYPNLMIDVPYFIWSTDGGFGGRGYVDLGPGRLSVYGLLDRAHDRRRTAADGTTLEDSEDQYTLTASYAVPLAGLVLEPMVMKTFPAGLRQRDDDGVLVETGWNSPLTVGASLTLPKLAGLTPSATFGYSWNAEADTADPPLGEYTAWLGRAKLAGPLGPGRLLAWADYGRRFDEVPGAEATENDFFYLWLNYAFTIYESERGSLTIGPQWRFIDVGRERFNLRERHKLEINFDVTFR